MRPLTEYQREIMHPWLLQARADAERLNIPDDAYFAFRNQFSKARQRKISFLFTLEEWWHWWQTYDVQHECVRWERRGKKKGSTALVMARFGDVGPYAPENVYCATERQNSLDTDPAKFIQEVYHPCPFRGIRGDGHPKARAVITPAGRFGSAALAAEHYDTTRAGAKYRADRRQYGWAWEQP